MISCLTCVLEVPGSYTGLRTSYPKALCSYAQSLQANVRTVLPNRPLPPHPSKISSTLYYWALLRNGNALNLYLGNMWLEYWAGHKLF